MNYKLDTFTFNYIKPFNIAELINLNMCVLNFEHSLRGRLINEVKLMFFLKI